MRATRRIERHGDVLGLDPYIGENFPAGRATGRSIVSEALMNVIK